MFVVCVTAFTQENRAEDFIRATLENARGTRGEPGNVRFDVLRGTDDPNRFFLYEVYRSEEDFKRHQQTDHYLRWRETVADWMAQPRQGVRHASLFPDDAAW
jgi:autoinducer 2-degrading protein